MRLTNLMRMWLPLSAVVALAAWVGTHTNKIDTQAAEIRVLKTIFRDIAEMKTDIAVMKNDLSYVKAFIQREERRNGVRR